MQIEYYILSYLLF